MGSRPPAFDDAVSSWSTYRVRLEAYFEGNDITDVAKRRALLVSSLSDSVVRILQGHQPGVAINSLTYDDVVKCLEEHFNPQANEIAASYSFFMRKQDEQESVRDYIAELRRLAVNCNFGATLDRMLRDRIVCGIRDEETRRCLLGRKNLTREEAEEFALASEKANEDARGMRTSYARTEGGGVNVVQQQGRQWRKNCSLSCDRCKGAHATASCRHRSSICHQCGKRGHLARACKRPHTPRSGTFAVDGTECESEEERLYALVAHSSANKHLVQPIERTLTWEGRRLRMIVDTGSPVSVIPKSLYKKHRKWWPALQKTPLRLSCFLGPLPVVGKVDMQVQLGPVTVSSSLIVVDHRGPLLCGRDTIEEFRKAGMLLVEGTSSSVNVVHADSQLTALLDEFPDLFENLGCCKGPPVKLYLKESAQPRFLKARTVPYAMRAQVSAEIDRLVEVGVLSPVSVAEWATPVVPVAKKNGDIRLCGDFKLTVNPATRTEQYPLPKIDDIFAALSGGEVFSTLDLRNAYNQLPLDDDAKKITVLNTHKGLFCCNRLAFGIASAPALFQRRIEAVLQGIPGVKVYLDDIIVAEKEYDTTILRQVFERLRANGLTLNKEKCHFREKEVVFLGHRIDAKGLHPLQDNLEAVLAAPPPTSVSQLKSFLGLVTYYSKFLPNLSSTLAPLHRLLSKGALWCWGPAQRTAFQETKRAMRRANFLVHYDPQRPLRLECDASAEGIGAVLSHRIQGVDHPIAFRSRTLTSAERNYSQLEKEALALVFGVVKFRDYLFGNKFTLVTDHKPLTGLLGPDKPIPQMAAARIQRWALLLAAYQYDLEYRKGELNANADALSRLPLPVRDNGWENELAEYVLHAQAMDDFALSAQSISDHTSKDDVLQQVKTWILQGWPRRLGSEEQQYQPYFARRHELAVSNGILYWGHRVVLPKAARQFVLKELHDTHPGITAMKNLARSIFWYPGLDGEIEMLAKRCPQCVQCLPMPPAQVPANWPKNNRRWYRLHVDFAGPVEGHMIFVLVDAETKWIEAVPLKTATAATTVDTLRCIFARFGIPRTVVSDNGPQFTSAETARFFRENGVRHVTTAPYYPQSNGLAERAVRTIKEGLKKNRVGTLQSRLAKFLLRYRTTPTREEQSPAERLFGFQPQTRLSTYLAEEDGAKREATVNGVPNSGKKEFAPGREVWSRQYSQLGQRWLPGTVTTVEGKRLLTVNTPRGVQRRHVDQVRPRDSSTPIKKEPCETPMAMEQLPLSSSGIQSTSSEALQAGLSEPGEEASGGGIEPASPRSTAEPLPLRRSTRARKPPDRF